MAAHAAVPLMSIFFILGGVPSSVTVPLIEPVALAGSNLSAAPTVVAQEIVPARIARTRIELKRLFLMVLSSLKCPAAFPRMQRSCSLHLQCKVLSDSPVGGQCDLGRIGRLEFSAV